MIEAPKISPGHRLRAIIFTKPLVLLRHIALPCSAKSYRPTQYAIPAAVSSFSTHPDVSNLRIAEDRVRADDPIIGFFTLALARVARRNFALVDRDVDEQIVAGDVADGEDVRLARPQRRVDGDTAPSVEGDAGRSSPRPLDVGRASHARKRFRSATSSCRSPSRDVTNDFARRARFSIRVTRVREHVDPFVTKVPRQRVADIVVGVGKQMIAADQRSSSWRPSAREIVRVRRPCNRRQVPTTEAGIDSSSSALSLSRKPVSSKPGMTAGATDAAGRDDERPGAQDGVARRLQLRSARRSVACP